MQTGKWTGQQDLTRVGTNHPWVFGTAADREKLADFAQANGLEFIAVFGSQARGTQRDDSDVDLAIMPVRQDAAHDRLSLSGLLSSTLHRGDVDATLLLHASWLMGAEVARDGRALYENRPGAFARFRLAARLRAMDSALWRRRQMEGMRRALAKDRSVNVDLVREKLASLMAVTRELDDMLGVSRQEFCSQTMRFRAAERSLELMVEYVAAINSEIASAAGIPPSDYYSSFFSASQAGWIPGDLAKTLAPMASLRNVLVHAYERIDTETLYDDLVGTMPAWERYAATILTRLETL